MSAMLMRLSIDRWLKMGLRVTMQMSSLAAVDRVSDVVVYGPSRMEFLRTQMAGPMKLGRSFFPQPQTQRWAIHRSSSNGLTPMKMAWISLHPTTPRPVCPIQR